MSLSNNFNNENNKTVRNKEIFTKYKNETEVVDYREIYNKMNYVSPSIHLARYLDLCWEYAKEGDKWLEVGCGSCRDGLQRVHKKGIDVYGFDVVKESVEIAQTLGLENVIEHSASETFPYDDNTFDFLSCCDVLEHLTPEDVTFAVSEIKRVLKPNSVCLLASCTHQSTDHVHLTIQSQEKWIELYEKNGMTCIKTMKPYGVFMRVLRKNKTASKY